MTTDVVRGALEDAVLLWQDAHARDDQDEMAYQRGVVLEHMFAPTTEHARQMLDDSSLGVEDVEALGVEVLVTTIEGYLKNFNPARADFCGYVFSPKGAWLKIVRRRVRGESADSDSFNESELLVLELYYGHRETFKRAHGYYPSIDQASENLRDEQIAWAYANQLRRHPEWTEPELRDGARRRVQRDGFLAALGRLEELLTGRHAADLIFADAPMGERGADGWSVLAEPVVESDETDDIPAWVRLATLGLDGRTRRRASRLLTGAALTEERVADKNLLKAARANMANPLAQFVVLAGVEGQIDQDVQVSGDRGDERALLLAAAGL